MKSTLHYVVNIVQQAVRCVPAAIKLQSASCNIIRANKLPFRTAFDGAVFSIPAGYTEAGSIFALTVLVATRVAQLCVAVLAAPSFVAGAGLADTAPVQTALEIAELCRRVANLIVDQLKRAINIPLEQSSPLHFGSQLQVWVSRSNVPCPLQSGRHCRASWSIVAQSSPFHPFLQMHLPSTQ